MGLEMMLSNKTAANRAKRIRRKKPTGSAAVLSQGGPSATLGTGYAATFAAAVNASGRQNSSAGVKYNPAMDQILGAAVPATSRKQPSVNKLRN